MRKGVQKLYKEVASTYEMINHVITFGLDIIWRKRAVREVAGKGGETWLDVCCGTGEMTRNLARKANSDTRICSVDFSQEMLSLAMKKKFEKKILFTLADVGNLPFPDETFDLLTISFSTRNLNLSREEMQHHLAEFFRVLKPEGRFLNLETSQPSSLILRKAFHLYIRAVVPIVGALISGSKAGYKYLAYTVPRFYSPKDFKEMLHRTGFRNVHFRVLFFGISAIHLAEK
ncbi:MAG: ubiquinone/menaquinone biosynthesis methyltransferase [Candidatus Aminicenantes bacterium]|nr:ubiquinone/menaquinone biosynthesis methyltransferase [Candidatus Aminicenantes bacterium]